MSKDRAVKPNRQKLTKIKEKQKLQAVFF